MPSICRRQLQFWDSSDLFIEQITFGNVEHAFSTDYQGGDEAGSNRKEAAILSEFMTEVPQPGEENPEVQTDTLHYRRPTRCLQGQSTLETRASR
jgi:hypothetical protein